MSSYRQILYHIIFRTKDGRHTLCKEHVDVLFSYIMGIIKNKNCFLYQINGIEDHVHFLSDLHPSIALADFMRDIKASSSLWLKQSGKFKNFDGWADGYATLTYSWNDKDKVVNYIKNQQEHHKIEVFEDELKRLLKEHGIVVDTQFFP